MFRLNAEPRGAGSRLSWQPWPGYAGVWLLISLSVTAAEVGPAALPPSAPDKIDFLRDVHPILQDHCLKCHSNEKPKSHFRLTSREQTLKGGAHGVDVIPGNSAQSPLIAFVAGLDPDMIMPPEGRGTPLTSRQIALLRAWIDQGVSWTNVDSEASSEVAISTFVGGTKVRGDSQKFRELYWQPDGWNGGLEQFEIWQKPSQDSKITVSGHVSLDDYAVKLALEKSELGFVDFGWTQFRTYYDDHGGYDPRFTPVSFSLNRDLHMDVGRAWADFGLTLPRWPRAVLGYEYQYRDGSEATLQWGPVGNSAGFRNLYPAFENTSEKVHVVKVDLDYQLAGFDLSDSFRGEWHSLENQRFNESSFTLGASSFALTTAKDQSRYFQGANTFHIEKQFADWWFGSGGYLYSKLNGDGSMNVDTLNPAVLDPSLFAIGWSSQSIELERESHVFSLSSLLGPWQGLSLTLGTQNEWTRQTGLATASLSVSLPFAPFIFPLDPPESLYSDLDRSIFTQDLGLRFTKIPFTTLFADARFQQDTLGQYEEEVNGLTPFLRNTQIESGLQDFRAGFSTAPWRRVSLIGDYRRYDNSTDYETPLKEPIGFQGYPAFFTHRDLKSSEAQTKLGLQVTAWLKTTLSYQWLDNHYRSTGDPVNDPLTGVVGGISPGGGLLAGTYRSQIASFNATVTPWRRLFLSSTFAFQHAGTRSDANDTPSIAPYNGNIYSAMANATLALNDKTDLMAAYTFSTADFSQDNLVDGLPLGTHYHQHALQAGFKRQIGKGKTLGVQYRYYRYSDLATGGTSDFEAHALFATFAWRLP
jgi:hypothetical protein